MRRRRFLWTVKPLWRIGSLRMKRGLEKQFKRWCSTLECGSAVLSNQTLRFVIRDSMLCERQETQRLSKPNPLSLRHYCQTSWLDVFLPVLLRYLLFAPPISSVMSVLARAKFYPGPTRLWTRCGAGMTSEVSSNEYERRIETDAPKISSLPRVPTGMYCE